MTARFRTPLRVAAVTAVAALVGTTVAFPAAAADGDDVQVINTETVQVYTSPTGEIETQRIYEQLALTGQGQVLLENPISTEGLRNLDGFSGFEVRDGQQVAEITVDGEKHLRSVSDYTGDLPLDVSVKYRLDGELVEPSDIVGEDGELEVEFTVKNVTAVPQEVTFPDGNGGTVTKTVDVPVPMVGSLTTTAPANFTEVRSDAANMAGDGKGGTKLSFTMTLFPPIGSDTARFSYTANITDGVVPEANVTALPVNPLESPTFASAATSYKGGADTGVELANGAAQIDSNLLKLRDGAAELLAGLIKLRDGAVQLEAGLAGEAAPGAARLADGAAQLSAGTEALYHGTGELVNGTGQLKAGAQKLNDGAGRIAAGAGELSDGAAQLRDGSALLSSKMGEAAEGGAKLHAGAGQLADGATKAAAGGVALSDGAHQLAEGLTTAGQKAPALLAGLSQVKAGLVLVDGGLAKMSADIGGLRAKAQPLHDGIGRLLAGIGSRTTEDSLTWAVDQVRSGLQGEAVPGLQKMMTGVEDSNVRLGCAIEILTDLRDGTLAKAGSTDECYESETNEEGTIPPLMPLTIPNPTDGLTPAEYQWVTVNSMITELSSGRAELFDTDAANNGENNVDASLYEGLGLVLSGLTSQDPNDPGALVALSTIECALDSTSLGATCGALRPGQMGVAQGLQAVNQGVTDLVEGVIAAVQSGVGTANDTAANKTLRGGTQDLIKGVDALSNGGSELLAGLGQLSDGANKLDAGAGELKTGLGVLALGSHALVGGSATLADGLVLLAEGAGDVSDGAGKVADGAGRLADGAGELQAGTERLEAGVGELDAGANKLRDGAGQLNDGAGQLSDGAGQLAEGLGDAADGSGQLAAGLAEAAEGAPKLVDGAERLSAEGTSKLVDAGQATAQNYGEMYAVIEAGAERAQTEKMAFGAPEGAIGLAAYSYEITGEDGEGGRNVARGLAALAVLAMAAGAFGLRRRMG